VTPETVASLMADVRRLRRGFAGTAPQPWTAATAAAELAVQAGHLALCLLPRGGADVTGLADARRPITDIGDELADMLLAILSVAALAGTGPAPSPGFPTARCDSESDAYLRLAAAAGQLAEAAMVADGFRHQPEGTPPSIEEAAATAVASCEALAILLGLDLPAAFRRMMAQAEAFLRSRGQPW
jgi:NTP pyrophosphatase (non-canonical NTP hydrolase)